LATSKEDGMDMDGLIDVEDTNDSELDEASLEDSGALSPTEIDDLGNADPDKADSKDQFSLEDLDAFAEQDIEADEELGDLLNQSNNDFDSKNPGKDKWVLESSDGMVSSYPFPHSFS
jgi:hypothetical protein